MKKPPAAASRSTRAGKPVSASVMEMTTIVLPEDTNKFGNLFGGRLMEWIDKAAAVAALEHHLDAHLHGSPVDHVHRGDQPHDAPGAGMHPRRSGRISRGGCGPGGGR